MFWLNSVKSFHSLHRKTYYFSQDHFCGLSLNSMTSISCLNWGCQSRRFNSSNDFNSGWPKDKTNFPFLLNNSIFYTPEDSIRHQNTALKSHAELGHFDLLYALFSIYAFQERCLHLECRSLPTALQTSARFSHSGATFSSLRKPKPTRLLV